MYFEENPTDLGLGLIPFQVLHFVIVFATFMITTPAELPFSYIAQNEPGLGSSGPLITQNKMTYLDHNATTPLYEGIQDVVLKALQFWGNPSSIHWASRHPKSILRETRRDLSQALHCEALELIFTSGGSEGNTTVIQSVFHQVFAKGERTKFITSTVEHPSVIKSFKAIAELGAEVIFVPVLKTGELDLEFFKRHLDHKTALVSIMAANNEFGTLFPIAEISALTKSVGALMHTDAVQALGKIVIDLKRWGVDYATFSAHKFYALKGCGFLYVRKGALYQSFILGGGQERHRRAGTENIVGLASLQTMVPFLSHVQQRGEQMRNLRDFFESQVKEKISNVEINADASERLPNTSSLILDGVDGETLLMSLDMKGFAVSTGAACSAGNPEPSPALLAMGLRRDQAQSSLRVSFGWGNSIEDVRKFVQVLSDTVAHLRALNRLQIDFVENNAVEVHR